MKSVTVKIWFEGDVGDASIEYIKTYNGNDMVAHNRFIREAQLKFRNSFRVTVTSI